MTLLREILDDRYDAIIQQSFGGVFAVCKCVVDAKKK